MHQVFNALEDVGVAQVGQGLARGDKFEIFWASVNISGLGRDGPSEQRKSWPGFPA